MDKLNKFFTTVNWYLLAIAFVLTAAIAFMMPGCTTVASDKNLKPLETVAAAPAKPASNKGVIAVIGLGTCGHWSGAILVDENGELHGSTAITAEEAQGISAGLPEHHTMFAMGPCLSADKE